MVIERARVRAVQKPWGACDLRPWSGLRLGEGPIGELWYERSASNSSLLLKLLATTEPLSIQVHPDDAYARKMGLPCGKTEAWYILSAKPDAKVAVGLTRRISAPQLREAIADGSIVDLVQWRRVAEGDVVFVPAGTIHAIGPGLVIAEIQQRSDTTFRMFDYGRSRALHVDDAVAVADAGPARHQAAPKRYTDARTLLVVDPHLILERIVLPPNSTWDFCPKRETWLFVAAGSAQMGSFNFSIADVVFSEGERVHINVGLSGLKALLAYSGPNLAVELLCNLTTTDLATQPRPLQPLTSTHLETHP